MNFGKRSSIESLGEKRALNYVKNKSDYNKNLAVFNVEANISDYTNLLTDIFQSNVQIFSFKPYKNTYAKLTRNTKK